MRNCATSLLAYIAMYGCEFFHGWRLSHCAQYASTSAYLLAVSLSDGLETTFQNGYSRGLDEFPLAQSSSDKLSRTHAMLVTLAPILACANLKYVPVY